MSLTKVNYIDKETVITAQNLNDIQDAVIELEKEQITMTEIEGAISAAIGSAIGGSY